LYLIDIIEVLVPAFAFFIKAGIFVSIPMQAKFTGDLKA
jgi:hypothetical protein